MERMNEILARAANRRIGARRIPTPAPTATNTTNSAPPTIKTASRRITPGQPSSKLARDAASLRPRASADASRPARPAADVADTNTVNDASDASHVSHISDTLENDRILEMPARPASGSVRPARSGSRSTEIAAIRELAPAYVAHLPRRSGRATPAVSPGPTSSPAPSSAQRGGDDRGATRASSQTTQTTQTTQAAQTTQGKRASRAAGKANAPGVCPLCHGAGYVRLDVPVGDPAFGQAVRCQCKEQQLEERDRGALRRLSNLDPFRDKTFEVFDAALPGVREAHEIAQRYADDPLGWLVFRGGYGCGKTHLAAAIANVAEQSGVPVIFAIVPDLLDHLRATFAPNSETAYDALFEKVREVQLLVLDDFGAENSTAWATEKLFQLINYRYNYRMPTVITTNHRLLAHMDERIRSRLADLGLVRHVVIEAADYRERHTGRPSRGGSRSRAR